MSEKRPPATRAPYEPPRVRKVKLAADELAVSGCKSQSVGGSTVVCRRGTVVTNRNIGS
jgi:hypothetical protein